MNKNSIYNEDDTKFIKIEINEENDIELKEIDINDIQIEIINKKDTNIIEMILKCLKYSDDAYGVNKETTLTHKTFENNIFNRVDLYYERINNNIFIAIRGTVTIYDIMNDINFIQEKMDFDNNNKDTEEIYVHKGFYRDFKDIKNFLIELINENLSTGVINIYFTGHSRGSSVSTLSSIYIKTLYPNLNIYNIGFGCPRLGCEKFANYYNNMMKDTTYLFRIEQDIVTKVPIYGYYDILNQFIIKNNKIISIYEPSSESLQDNIIEIVESNLEHHKLINYINCDYKCNNKIIK
jgi:hypothetical protein